MKLQRHVQVGFTLVEMAIVLAIVGLLISGLLLPLGVQRDLRDYQETRVELSELREALIGYALSHSASDGRPYLPCPDTDADGQENRDAFGECNAGFLGDVPWSTLGLGQSDSWNRAYLYQVAPLFSDDDIGFTLTTVGNLTIRDAVAGNAIASNIPAVIVSKGKNGDGAGTADEDENSDTNTTYVSHEQIDVAGSEFDDVVVWVPSTILFNRMVTAGRLP